MAWGRGAVGHHTRAARYPPSCYRGNESGSVTLWVLYWSVIVLFISGFAVDLWRGVSTRRALVEQAEAAAAAGANGIDEAVFRATGDVELNPDLVIQLVQQSLVSQGESHLVDEAAIRLDPETNEVTVAIVGEIDFTLVRIFLSDEEPLRLEVSASAAPRIGRP